VRRAGAQLARAGSEVELARSTLARLEALREGGVASEAARDEARNAARVAEAARAEAAAVLDDARRSLERTRLVAPYAGRVRREQVDTGQFVNAGQPVARIYAIDYAEVRLPIRDAELAHLDLSLDAAEHSRSSAGPRVVLRAFFAGAAREWTGRIVRSEGEIDPQSRMLHVVARVDDPYGRAGARGHVPLAVGLFVDAEIEGRELRDVISLPQAALREDGRVFVVDAEGRLRLTAVEVIRPQDDAVLVRAPIAEGALVCISQLPGASEGMRVRTRVREAS
jgi:RND family efflux transporter MFP subunit